MIDRRNLIVSVLVILGLTVIVFPNITSSQKQTQNITQAGEYDPWADINDDGNINILDVGYLAAKWQASGEPINKTALLLELQTRIEILEASILTYSSTNSSQTDITFSTDYREMLDMSLNITLTRRSRLLIMFSAGVGVYFPNDVISVRALVNGSIADPGEIGFFPEIGEADGHRHWLGFRPNTFNFLQLSDPGFYTIKIEWKISEGGGGVANRRTLIVIALPE